MLSLSEPKITYVLVQNLKKPILSFMLILLKIILTHYTYVRPCNSSISIFLDAFLKALLFTAAVFQLLKDLRINVF